MGEELHEKIRPLKVRETFEEAVHGVTGNQKLPVHEMAKVAIGLRAVIDSYKGAIHENETFQQLKDRDPKRYEFLVEKLRQARELGHKL